MQALSQLSYGPVLPSRLSYLRVHVCGSLLSFFRSGAPHTIRETTVTPQPECRLAVNKKDPVIGRVLVVRDEWRPHGDSNPGRHRERVMS